MFYDIGLESKSRHCDQPFSTMCIILSPCADMVREEFISSDILMHKALRIDFANPMVKTMR